MKNLVILLCMKFMVRKLSGIVVKLMIVVVCVLKWLVKWFVMGISISISRGSDLMSVKFVFD